MPVRTIHYGVGAIGQVVLREALQRPDLEVVAVFDSDAAKRGRDAGDVIGLGREIGITVSSPTEGRWPAADVVLHAAGSQLEVVAPHFEAALTRGLNVVSICEELSFPWDARPDLAARLDRLARDHEVTLLGTGVNPGFAMDTWVVALTAICCRIDEIEVTRTLDAAQRRLPLQQKVGAGMTTAEFAERANAGSLGHVGLVESATAVARALGWTPFHLERTLEPVIAERALASREISVKAGGVAGIHEVIDLTHSGRRVLRLDLTMAMGITDPADEVRIVGDPPVHVVAKGGFHGDRATVGIMLNAIASVRSAPPGLMTMRDLPPVRWRASAVPAHAAAD